MSMETFIPIIIAIVVFAFQAYANYQKEQAKARQRNPAQPPLPEDNAERIKPVPVPAAAPVPSPTVNPQFGHYSGVVDAVEPTRSSRQGTLVPQRLEVDAGADVQPAFDAEEFDLRDAVIKSIILERPYK